MRDLGLRRGRQPEPRRPRTCRAPADRRRATPRARRSGSRTRSRPSTRELRTTLLGSLLDAARHNLARGAERVALFESGRAYLRDGSPPARRRRSAGEFAGERAAAGASSRTRIAALAVGPLRPGGWRERRGPAGLLRAQGRARGARAPSSARRSSVEPGERAVPAPGPRRPVLRRRRATPAGSARSIRSSAATWDLDGRRRLRGRPRAAGRRLAGRRGALRGRDLLSGRPPGPRGRRRRGRAGRAGARGRRSTAAASCCGRAEVFDLYRGEQVGEGRKSLALRLEFRAADRTLTDEEVAERREAIEAGARRDRGVAP